MVLRLIESAAVLVLLVVVFAFVVAAKSPEPSFFGSNYQATQGPYASTSPPTEVYGATAGRMVI